MICNDSPQSREDLAEPRQLAKNFDLFNLPDGYFDSPYPWFKLLRDHDPVHENSDGTVLLTRYDDVRTLWREATASVEKKTMFAKKFGEGPLLDHHTQSILFTDPPDHDRLRATISPFFVPKSLERFRVFIEELVDRLLDEAEELHHFDFVTDFAAKIPVHLITRILGLPPEDSEFLRSTGAKVLFPLNPKVSDEAIAAGHNAVFEFSQYLENQMEIIRSKKLERDPETVLESLVQTQQVDGTLTNSEIIHLCLLAFNGGHETTTNLMAVGTYSLLGSPDQYRDMRENAGELGSAAIEEIVRYVTPLQLQGRRISDPLELPSGVTLPKGTEVIISQASANRDDRMFDNPDQLNLRRKPNNHIAFGLGVHSCLGISLARLETRIMFPRLTKRFPKLRLDGSPVFNQNVRFRGLAELPVSVS